MILIRIHIQATFRICVNILLIWAKFNDGKPTISALPTSLSSTTATESKLQIATTRKKSPIEIADGQSFTNKLKVMRLLSELENRLDVKSQIQRNNTESQQMPYIYEGDIILTPIQAQEILESTNKRKRRKLHANLTMLWNLPIHYRFDGSHSSENEMLIRHAIKYWESQTCIKFLEVQSDSQISNTNNVTVVFRQSDMCWSFVGRNEFPPTYEQTVSVSRHCINDGSILHELGHLIGFWHEHQRPDRNDYITIFKHNIKPHHEFSFFVQTWKAIDSKNVPYDVGSVMHYGETAFSIGDQPTIISRNYLLSRALGQRFDLSFYDVKLTNLGYCKNSCQSSTHLPACLHEGYQDPNDCSKCRCPEGLSGRFCEKAAPANNPYQNLVSDSKRQSYPTWYDSLDCGGTLTLTLRKSFKFGISTYKYLRQCNWLFKAPTGTNIEFVLSDTFLNYRYCTPDSKYPCRDFVEVKYNHSLAATGARLCCSNNMTLHPITSQGNEMLVLFRAYGNGDIGFSATVLSRQNKNQFVMGYFMWRVMTGRHTVIEYMMQVPGHARCHVDSGFASLKKLYRRSDCDCLDQLQSIVEKSSTTNFAVRYPSWNWREWKTFLQAMFRPLKGIRQYQYFRFSANEPGVVTVKRNCDATEEKIRIIKPDITIVPGVLPEILNAGGLSADRPCGGCYSTDDQPTMPCSIRVNFTCESIWKEKNWKACKHGLLNKDCGLNVNHITSRPSTCYRDELYCCAGYVLQGNKCIAVAIHVI